MNRRDPTKRFWLTAEVGNLDGTIEFDSSIPDAFDTCDAALEQASETAEQGLDCFIYECQPVYVVKRGKIRIKKLGRTP